jgi:membrane fusion protein, multidrug efflux system
LDANLESGAGDPTPDASMDMRETSSKRGRWRIGRVPSRMLVPAVVVSLAALAIVFGRVMVERAEADTNHVALASQPRPVSIIEAAAAQYRATRTYVGTIDPWIEANIGPQLVSAYVDTVLVRPGAAVRKGEVLATLDCRNSNATAQSVAMQARALEAEQQAVSHEAARVQQMLDGGFVSPNEAEQKNAQSASRQAELLSTKARLLGKSLEINDCILRSPFDGEVATRMIDPGAYVHPGNALVSVIDRNTVRIVADAPEADFGVVGAGTEVDAVALSTGRDLKATISRRAPAADAGTRTVHFEIDVQDPDRAIPVGTTAEIHIEVGEPVASVKVPIRAATIRGDKAKVFVVDGNVAHARNVAVVGEVAGELFLDPSLPRGAKLVVEGRGLLNDGDLVAASPERSASLDTSGNRKEVAR